MTDLAIKYVATPFSKLFDNFIDFFESVGRSRAAAELMRQGYYEEAKRLMLEQK